VHFAVLLVAACYLSSATTLKPQNPCEKIVNDNRASFKELATDDRGPAKSPALAGLFVMAIASC
jgi:hypothetical protein